jgi:hypothetical protein
MAKWQKEKWATLVNYDMHGSQFTVSTGLRGISGNIRFPFLALNNAEITDHLSAWLKDKKKLDM